MATEPRIRVSAILRWGGRILLCRHEKDGRHYWLLPGGGVNSGESLVRALHRELSEEVGVNDEIPVEGPVAIAFVHGDAAAAAKVLREFGKNHEALVLKGGLLGERVITSGEIAALAELPSREVLLTQIAGLFQQPLTRAAGLFQAFPRNFAYGVQALIDQRIAGGEAAREGNHPCVSRRDQCFAEGRPAGGYRHDMARQSRGHQIADELDGRQRRQL